MQNKVFMLGVFALAVIFTAGFVSAEHRYVVDPYQFYHPQQYQYNSVVYDDDDAPYLRVRTYYSNHPYLTHNRYDRAVTYGYPIATTYYAYSRPYGHFYLPYYHTGVKSYQLYERYPVHMQWSY